MRHLLLSALTALLTNCTLISVHTQEGNFRTPTHQSPIRITPLDTSSAIVIRPHISLKTKNKISLTSENHTYVNEDGVYEVRPVDGEDYFIEVDDINFHEFEGKDIFLETPVNQFGLDLEFRVGSGSVYGAYQLSSGNISGWSAQAGMGKMFRSGSLAFRGDIGFMWQRSYYDVRFAVREEGWFGGDTRVEFFERSGSQKHWDVGLGFTINTLRQDWPVNGFFNFAFSLQSLVELPESAGDSLTPSFEYSGTVQQFGAGVFGTVLPGSRFLAGMRYNYYPDKWGGAGFWDLVLQWELEL